eukprot:1026021-Pelagomonas_calceolata.AAC.1
MSARSHGANDQASSEACGTGKMRSMWHGKPRKVCGTRRMGSMWHGKDGKHVAWEAWEACGMGSMESIRA